MRSAGVAAIVLVTVVTACGDEPPRPPPPQCALKHLPAWSRSTRGVGGAVTFNEVMYHPAAGAPEWIELYNPLAIDADISGFRLDGAIDYTFVEGTRIPPGGFLVVASDGAMP